MNVLHGFKTGDKVTVTYNPMPYLGTGIQEPVSVSGTLQAPKVNRGITYVVLKDANGKCVLERNVMEISHIVAAGATQEAPEVVEARTARNYNRA